MSAKGWAVMVGLCLAMPALAAGHPQAGRFALKKQVSGVVNLNTASAAQLDSVPWVSTRAARAVVAYRAQHPFTRTEELVKVKGFGKKSFERIKRFLTVHGPTTLKVTAPPQHGRKHPRK